MPGSVLPVFVEKRLSLEWQVSVLTTAHECAPPIRECCLVPVCNERLQPFHAKLKLRLWYQMVGRNVLFFNLLEIFLIYSNILDNHLFMLYVPKSGGAQQIIHHGKVRKSTLVNINIAGEKLIHDWVRTLYLFVAGRQQEQRTTTYNTITLGKEGLYIANVVDDISPYYDIKHTITKR